MKLKITTILSWKKTLISHQTVQNGPVQFFQLNKLSKDCGTHSTNSKISYRPFKTELMKLKADLPQEVLLRLLLPNQRELVVKKLDFKDY